MHARTHTHTNTHNTSKVKLLIATSTVALVHLCTAVGQSPGVGLITYRMKVWMDT